MAYEHVDGSKLRVRQRLVLGPNRRRELPWANRQLKSAEPSAFFHRHLESDSRVVILVSEYLQSNLRINTLKITHFSTMPELEA